MSKTVDERMTVPQIERALKDLLVQVKALEARKDQLSGWKLNQLSFVLPRQRERLETLRRELQAYKDGAFQGILLACNAGNGLDRDEATEQRIYQLHTALLTGPAPLLMGGECQDLALTIQGLDREYQVDPGTKRSIHPEVYG